MGCCSLRVEHIELHDQKGEDEFVVEFDFLGKDSIRWVTQLSVNQTGNFLFLLGIITWFPWRKEFSRI